MMVIDNKYSFGDFVYLATDTDQLPRIVTAIKICGDNGIIYELSLAQNSSWHYDFEITSEKTLL